MIRSKLHKYVCNCLYPRYVRNKYTGQSILVPCGKCIACTNKSSVLLTSLCSQEESDHKYCYFVTLTYAPEFLPTMKYVPQGKFHGLFFGSNPRCSAEYNKVISSTTMDQSTLFQLFNKSRLPFGTLSYCCVDDQQKFLKRLRHYVYKNSHEKIRYFSASEYGPKTFRAHYHYLFYFDKLSTLYNFRKYLRASWQFGRVDASLSKRKCGSYVAGYVNSFACTPSILTQKVVRPRMFKSNYFGTLHFEKNPKAIYNDVESNFTECSGNVLGTYSRVLPSRSCKNRTFPKVRGYARKSFEDLYQSYTLYYRLCHFTGLLSVSNQTNYFIDLFNSSADDALTSDVSRQFLNETGLTIDDFSNKNLLIPDKFKHVRNIVYNTIHTSYHFLHKICQFSTNAHYIKHNLFILTNFYAVQDLKQLSNFYAMQEEYSQSPCYSSMSHFKEGFLTFYDNAHTYLNAFVDLETGEYFPPLMEQLGIIPSKVYYLNVQQRQEINPLYRSSYSAECKIHDDKIKHKELNDANAMFCNN